MYIYKRKYELCHTDYWLIENFHHAIKEGQMAQNQERDTIKKLFLSFYVTKYTEHTFSNLKKCYFLTYWKPLQKFNITYLRSWYKGFKCSSIM